MGMLEGREERMEGGKSIDYLDRRQPLNKTKASEFGHYLSQSKTITYCYTEAVRDVSKVHFAV